MPTGTPCRGDRLAPILVAALLLGETLALSPPALAVLFAFAVAALAAVLVRAWRLARRGHPRIRRKDEGMMQLHIALHAVLFSFAPWVLFSDHPPHWLPLWVVAFAPFFLSGRHTWRSLNEAFPSPLYFMFARGNTAAGLASLILATVATALGWVQALVLLEGLLQLYVAAHCMLTAHAVRKIAMDLESTAGPPTAS